MTNQLDLVFENQGQAATDSLIISQAFNKRHDRVLQDIRTLGCSDEFRLHNFVESSYMNNQNKEMPCFVMTKKGFTLLAMGYTGPEAMKFKEKYIDQFDRMEESIRTEGAVSKPLSDRQQRILHLQTTLEHEEKFVQVDSRLEKLEKDTRIDSFQQTVIQKQIGSRVARVHRDENLNPDQLDKKKIYPQLHRNLRDSFRVPSYRDIRRIDFDDAVAWIKNWRPMI
ncbi:Rha family transcriptional regulator [Jeotgalibacillus aurantiacus]|uniref:Rha family transcriptional regulator n=1 Tax=Jeotgalibacillus aurantiacus TaxID=2763266 RepID=UPI001D0BB848|nr:Rha family transcriptional regulator [Jeotgalibacillus aurantiacus]